MCSRKNEKSKSFRIRSNELFLTYSQCPLSPNDALLQLKSLLKTYQIESYLISQEDHQDNKGVHLHCYIRTNRKVDIKNPTRLDLVEVDPVEDGTRYHGNYKSVTKNSSKATEASRNRVLDYLIKDIFDFNDSKVIMSPDIERVINKTNASILSYQEVMISLARKGEIAQAMRILEEKNPSQYLKSHMSIEKSLMSLYLKELGLRPKFDLDQFVVPAELSETIKAAVQSNQTFVLKGESGTAKSSFITAYSVEKLNLRPVLINDVNSIRTFDSANHNAIIIDDADFSNIPREKLIKLLDSESRTTIRVTFGSISIPEETQRFVITNRSLVEMNPNAEDLAVQRRVREYDIGATNLAKK